MKGAFDPLRSPARWRSILKQFPHGCHWPHVVANLLAIVVVTLNDGLIDSVDTRRSPRITLSTRGLPRNKRTLSLALPDRRQNIPILLGEKTIILGDEWISLAGTEGPMQLVDALVTAIEKFWRSSGE